MEWLKNKSLKQSFLIISIVFLCAGLILSYMSFMLCVKLINEIDNCPKYEILIDENGDIVSNGQIEQFNKSEQMDISTETENKSINNTIIIILNIFQFVLPVFFVILSLVLADFTFYRLKLKKPLAVLQNGAERIQEQDLDFKIEKYSDDEIGRLCGAFEKMRKELLNNNRELWRQMEERKRLNAAFSHDLRNPVTVLKGSAKLTRQGVENGRAAPEQIVENLIRIEEYSGRIERYVETMSNVQRLEQISLNKKNADWNSLIDELKKMIEIIGLTEDRRITFKAFKEARSIFIDKFVLFQIIENLTANACRFARHTVNVSMTAFENELVLTVADDGFGFSSELLKNGIQPFQKGNEEAGHFGMGLYICKLLCQKHGGSLEIKNNRIGACVLAIIKIN